MRTGVHDASGIQPAADEEPSELRALAHQRLVVRGERLRPADRGLDADRPDRRDAVDMRVEVHAKHVVVQVVCEV